jgi:squalene cyclase
VVYPGTCGLSSLAALEGRSSPAVQASRQWLIGVQSEEGRIGDGPSTTSSAIMSLLDAGEPSDSPSLRKAALYLKRTQTAEGYWQGWMGPELTTLYCIQALTRLGEPATSKAVQSAVSWVLSKQKPDGSLFDIRAPAVSAQEVIAATTIGLTALALLCIADTGIKAGPTVLEEALKWLIAEQQADGSWRTPERPNPFDTVMAVQALFTYKGLEAREQVRKGVEWLLKSQQPNGSWGDLMGATHIVTHSLTKIKAITQVY